MDRNCHDNVVPCGITCAEFYDDINDLLNWAVYLTAATMKSVMEEVKNKGGIEPDKWENPSFQLGYFIDKGYTRKGYAKEASKRSMKFIFDDLHATKIRLFTRDTNIASYKLAESLGFVKEGHDRENIKHEGKMIGLFHYGLLKKEYLQNTDYNK